MFILYTQVYMYTHSYMHKRTYSLVYMSVPNDTYIYASVYKDLQRQCQGCCCLRLKRDVHILDVDAIHNEESLHNRNNSLILANGPKTLASSLLVGLNETPS